MQASRRRREREEDYYNLRKALCVGYANQLAERMVYHNGYRTLGFKPQVVQVFPSLVTLEHSIIIYQNTWTLVFVDLILLTNPPFRVRH